jgi:DMSO/TMAO reductase YedYZ heme-binding membrane subunit
LNRKGLEDLKEKPNEGRIVSAGPWHLRNLRKLIYAALVLAILGVAIASTWDVSDSTHAWIGARELFGLWALSLLLASMIPGPLSFVLPWIPFRGHLILGRRALGISSFVMAVAHVICYLGPTLLRNWHDLFTPGALWVAGLSIGLPTFVGLAVLAFTSRRSSIRNLGPHRWKRWHQLVYLLLPGVLIHATFLGADFGLNKGPDVNAEVDAGCLITMLSVTAAWLILFLLRRRHVRWTPAIAKRFPG